MFENLASAWDGTDGTPGGLFTSEPLCKVVPQTPELLMITMRLFTVSDEPVTVKVKLAPTTAEKE
jgi:hypothetical protein